MNSSRAAASLMRRRHTIGSLIPKRNATQGSGGATDQNPYYESLYFGKRQIEQLKFWVPTLGLYGASAFTALVYFTDWHVITDYIPIYRGKYEDQANQAEK